MLNIVKVILLVLLLLVGCQTPRYVECPNTHGEDIASGANANAVHLCVRT